MNSSNDSRSSKEPPEGKSDSETIDQKESQPHDRREIGGPPGLEPTRYGDWEKGGRCIDF
jgi:hypothetical protein